MKTMFRLKALALALSLVMMGSTTAHAAEPLPSDLPAEAVLRAHILQQPDVLGASSALRADQAESDRLQAGPHEFNVRLSAQRRRSTEPMVDGTNSRQHFMESQLAVERTVRAWGKADQDEKLGQATIALGQMRRADAIHEASRRFLRTWMDWQRESATARLWQEQVQAQAELTRIAQQRVKAGDAARTEWRQQEAMAAQLQTEAVQARARAAALQAILDTRYPGLTASAQPALLPPTAADLPGVDVPTLAQQLRERSHEARLARLQAELAEAQARRIQLERRADPTLGVYAASERGGAERLLGISVSMPISGAARSAADRQAQAQAQQALQASQLVDQRVHAEALAACLDARASYEIWTHQLEALRRQEEVLQTTVKGWQLGEFSQADVLLARRQYTDAALAEIKARTEARHNALRIKLDLHDIWEFDEE
jgi:outer membrane protein TolC